MNHSKTLLLTLLSLTLPWASVLAESVTLTEPGTLSESVSEIAGATQLSVTGPMNAVDFQFISNEMQSLAKLDLSKASISAYSGTPLRSGRTDFAANTLPAYSLAGSKLTEIKLPSSLTTIGEGALSSTPIENLSIPAGVTTIESGAFNSCTKLKTVTVPAAVTVMGDRVFASCASLTTATLQIAELPDHTFEMCTSLEKVNQPSGGFSSIGESAFRGCTALSSFTFGTSLASIGNSAFELSGIQQADMSGCPRLENIGARSFAQCGSLATVIMPECVKTIGTAAFFDDTALVSINFPASCKELAPYLFKGNNNVDTTSIVHSGVTAIGEYALMGLDHATTFTLPDALQSIGDHAMEGWTSLERLNVIGITEVPETGADVWEGVQQPQVDLIVGQGMAEKFETAPQWQEFHIIFMSGIEDVTVPESDPTKGVKARFAGTDLIITAPETIDTVTLHDASGMELLRMNPGSDRAVMDTSDRTARIYIVTVVLESGSSVTFKLAR